MKTEFIGHVICVGQTVIAVFVVVWLSNTNNMLEADNKALLQALDCGVPKKGQVLHITPKLDGPGYDCSVSSWKQGQWFVVRT